MPRAGRVAAAGSAAAIAALAAATIAATAPAPIDPAGYGRMIAGLKGRVVVVNMWATWCEPCREEFPDFVRLHREMRGRGLEVVAISMDLPDRRDSAVIPFLASVGAAFPTYLKSAGDDEAFINAVDPGWSGGLPATFVYDARGRRVKNLSGSITFEQLRRAVDPLLEGAPGR